MKRPGAVFWVSATILAVLLANRAVAQSAPTSTNPVRQKLLMDFDWRFALGNAGDPARDLDPANGSFSYLAKAGNGTGAADTHFDDRDWRRVNLPNDWAVALPFSKRGSGSHGYKAIGRHFPENSVSWYRKTFLVPASDSGKHISIEFEGVYRDSEVWVNGFYLGRESSGYSSFSYDLTDYLNYGGENTIAVRVNASLEEGWFYEGAGIYRHVWMVVTSPLHVAHCGTFVTSKVKNSHADVIAQVTVRNDAPTEAHFQIEQTILNADGNAIAGSKLKNLSLDPGASGKYSSALIVSHPHLWSVESPYLHTLVTTIRSNGAVVDRYKTPFGIRTIRWTANDGFFLNGKHVELQGTCNHQDAAGVGIAVPDALNVWRLKQLKKIGCNAIRTSHNAPSPELLDACDRLGMLVMDENRETGINPQELDELKALIRRDRNHPSVIIWSLGNEEWNIEGNGKGARVTQTMQTLAHRLDPTRPCTVAISGGWGRGSSRTVDVMGFNYYTHGNEDQYHAEHPHQPCVGTEDGSTFSTRGVYVEDLKHQHLTAYDTNKPNWGVTAEESWSHCMARTWLAGQFEWTGFDYRGEETPFDWPAISSQFGILDTCGFPKDNAYYYESWWSNHPVLHVFPHWNWAGSARGLPGNGTDGDSATVTPRTRERQDIDVWVFSNCQEVELFLNGRSLGRKPMAKYSHLEWDVPYEPGSLLARGYNAGKDVIADQVETTGTPVAVQLTPDRSILDADGEDVSVITVQVNDTKARHVPTADNEITFELTGQGRIIGVGNGDPSSHEPDQCIPGVSSSDHWKRSLFNGLAQVIVQSKRQPGEITLTASSPGLSPCVLKLHTRPTALHIVEDQ